MPSAVIAGAGVFGSALARHLARDGWDVTLLDPEAPGHGAAASGGETRLIRSAHGTDTWYPGRARRALELWRELEAETGERLLEQAGILWLARRPDGWEDASARVLEAQGIPVERLAVQDAARLLPGLAPDGLSWVLHEPEAGVLRARAATVALARSAVAHGARLRCVAARPDGATVRLADGTRLGADRIVWACGAWLAGLFPGLVRLRITRQETHHFAAPPRWRTPPLPAWCDYDGAAYGHGDVDGHGLKLSSDAEGPPFDVEHGSREPTAAGERTARALLAERFPALADAPVSAREVCQYALSEDTELIVAPHPEHPHVWLLGGGSGHGFKHGPALAEYVALLISGDAEPDPRFGLGPRGRRRSLRTAGTPG